MLLYSHQFFFFLLFFFFFFFKQKTAYEMRISDWSSDVCSSDLGHGAVSSAVCFFGGDKADLAHPLGLREIDDLVDRVVPGGLVAADVDRRLRGFLGLDRQLAFKHVTGDRLVVPVDVPFLGDRQGAWLHLVLGLVCLVEVGLWTLEDRKSTRVNYSP